MKFGILQFPGSCDERDTLEAARLFGDAELLWHAERDLKNSDVIVIPGGFSYGDYLRVGAIARFSPVMEEVTRFAEEGGLVLGICNGFQVLCEAGLLPGALLTNDSLRFVCKDVNLEVLDTNTAFTCAYQGGSPVTIPVKHMSGRYYAPPELLADLEASNQVLIRYCEGENPNGSLQGIAGVRSKAGNVFGLMPHPEHAVDALCGSTDGARIFQSLSEAVA